ncbi:hypothetical protein MTE1_4903 [Klebsiella pneumoniae JHCK1]|nr:hypothetical protein MTE1_4903 [Klebsiella pneumoniae JHCK1]
MHIYRLVRHCWHTAFCFFRVAHTFQRARNIGFGVNEEQATDHHGIAFIQAGTDAGLLL